MRHTRLLPFILGALTAFGPLSIDMYLPALPTIQRELGTTATLAQLSLAAYFAGLGVSQLFYGPLVDRFGRKPPLFAGMVLYAVASLGCAMAPNIHVLIGMRFLQATGGAAGPVIARAVVRDLYRGHEAARLLSLLMLVMGAAPILAPLAGGALLGGAGWRAIFFVLAALGLLCAGAAAVLLPETARHLAPRLELRAIGRALRALAEDRHFVVFTLVGGTAMAGMFAYISGSPFVIIELHHVPPSRFGWFFGANAFALITASQVNHRLLGTGHTPLGLLRAALFATIGAGVVLVVHALTGVGGLPLLAVGLFVFVGSLGFINPNATALAMEEQGTRAGLASAALGSLQFVVATVASSLVGVLNDNSARPMAFVMAGCALLAGALVVRARQVLPA